MTKILISSCLLGHAVRYDGAHKRVSHPLITDWQTQGLLVPVCPEIAGGLPIPRLPAERIERLIMTAAGDNVTSAFLHGAELALALCKQHEIAIAILKESSPSCGSSHIYDGTFTGKLVSGAGITTELLRENGIQVFNEHQLEQVESLLKL